MGERPRLVWLLGAAATIQIAGRIRDLIWHATHKEFEATSQQFVAHWLLWLGVITTMSVCVMALRSAELPDGTRRGFLTTFVAGLAYVPVAVWHFIEHVNHNDPSVAHVLLGVFEFGMISGVVLVFVATRQRPRGEIAAAS